ncbi:hypothetical protein IVB30_33645 [Bradyrhizobium sp. 200]|nr:hypothetical protein [Bradyrhizobium sp. 200]UPJ48033.1 hypothetical protein IVB30_33645 [Bradyrhizobium sp. 200]
MTAVHDKSPTAIRVVIPFVFRHWLQQPIRAVVVIVGLPHHHLRASAF